MASPWRLSALATLVSSTLLGTTQCQSSDSSGHIFINADTIGQRVEPNQRSHAIELTGMSSAPVHNAPEFSRDRSESIRRSHPIETSSSSYTSHIPERTSSLPHSVRATTQHASPSPSPHAPEPSAHARELLERYPVRRPERGLITWGNALHRWREGAAERQQRQHGQQPLRAKFLASIADPHLRERYARLTHLWEAARARPGQRFASQRRALTDPRNAADLALIRRHWLWRRDMRELALREHADNRARWARGGRARSTWRVYGPVLSLAALGFGVERGIDNGRQSACGGNDDGIVRLDAGTRRFCNWGTQEERYQRAYNRTVEYCNQVRRARAQGRPPPPLPRSGGDVDAAGYCF